MRQHRLVPRSSLRGRHLGKFRRFESDYTRFVNVRNEGNRNKHRKCAVPGSTINMSSAVPFLSQRRAVQNLSGRVMSLQHNPIPVRPRSMFTTRPSVSLRSKTDCVRSRPLTKPDFQVQFSSGCRSFTLTSFPFSWVLRPFLPLWHGSFLVSTLQYSFRYQLLDFQYGPSLRACAPSSLFS